MKFAKRSCLLISFVKSSLGIMHLSLWTLKLHREAIKGWYFIYILFLYFFGTHFFNVIVDHYGRSLTDCCVIGESFESCFSILKKFTSVFCYSACKFLFLLCKWFCKQNIPFMCFHFVQYFDAVGLKTLFWKQEIWVLSVDFRIMCSSPT